MFDYCTFIKYSNVKKSIIILLLLICAALCIFFSVEASKLSKDDSKYGGYITGAVIFAIPSYALLDCAYQFVYNTMKPDHCTKQQILTM